MASLSKHQKKLLIEAHPDRYNGDTAKLQAYYRKLGIRKGFQPGESKCSVCSTTIQNQTVTGMCKVHARELRYYSKPVQALSFS